VIWKRQSIKDDIKLIKPRNSGPLKMVAA